MLTMTHPHQKYAASLVKKLSEAPPPDDQKKNRYHGLKAYLLGGIPVGMVSQGLLGAWARGPATRFVGEVAPAHSGDWRADLARRAPKTLPDGSESILHSPTQGLFSPRTLREGSRLDSLYNFADDVVQVGTDADWKVGAHEFGHKLDFTAPEKGVGRLVRHTLTKNIPLRAGLGLVGGAGTFFGGVTGNEELLAAGLLAAAVPSITAYRNELAANRRAETLLRPEHADEYRTWAKSLQQRGYRRNLPIAFALGTLIPTLGTYGVRKHLDRRNPRVRVENSAASPT